MRAVVIQTSQVAMFLCIEIGGTKLQLVVGDGSGQISERRKLAVNLSLGAQGIRNQIEATLPELLRAHKVTAIGVGFGGPVNRETGRIARSHQIEGWSDFDLAGWLKKISGVCVIAENDANTAALGEAVRGAGVGFNPAFYVTLGSGVGGGLVVDGKIYHGATPGESEIGHVRISPDGTTLESRCSGWALDQRIRDLNQRHPNGLLAKLCHGVQDGEARFLVPALEQGDAAARQILHETAATLAFGLSHVVHLFHPAVIILGGGLSQIGEPLRAGVEKELHPLLMEVFHPGPQIRLASLGEDAVPTGALLLAGQS